MKDYKGKDSTPEFNELMRLEKEELATYIQMMTLVSTMLPYRIVHPTEDSKQKFLFIVDRKSTRGQTLWALFRYVITIVKSIW